MNWTENNSGFSRIPDIRLVISKYQSLGPGGTSLWQQKDVHGPYWRIYWNDSPGAFVSINGKEVELTPKKIVVLAPDTVYSTKAKRLVNHFYIHCFVGSPFSKIKQQMFVFDETSLVQQASQIAESASLYNENWKIQTKLLIYINSILLAIPDECISEYTRYSAKIACAMKIIDGKRRISNSELARHANMSRNGFLFLFRKETEMSPQAYSRELRLNDACVMLQHSDRSIDEIASETGFCDRYHFSRAFKRKIGCSPAKFRLRNYPSSGSGKQ